jgi:hypothetical protein
VEREHSPLPEPSSRLEHGQGARAGRRDGRRERAAAPRRSGADARLNTPPASRSPGDRCSASMAALERATLVHRSSQRPGSWAPQRTPPSGADYRPGATPARRSRTGEGAPDSSGTSGATAPGPIPVSQRRAAIEGLLRHVGIGNNLQPAATPATADRVGSVRCLLTDREPRTACPCSAGLPPDVKYLVALDVLEHLLAAPSDAAVSGRTPKSNVSAGTPPPAQPPTLHGARARGGAHGRYPVSDKTLLTLIVAATFLTAQGWLWA